MALPSEHGGWGLTIEPGLLGLLVAPSASGLCIALAAVVAFTSRTPLKTVAVDLRRGRRLTRTRIAALVGAAELLVLAALVIGAAVAAESSFWAPLVVAAPLVVIEMSAEVRSHGRRLVPELAGSLGVCSVAAMIVLADAGPGALAAGVWLVLAARVLSSIPWVRSQVARLHGRGVRPVVQSGADLAAVVAAGVAVVVEHDMWLGALAVLAVIAAQRLMARQPPPRAAIIGARQVLLGLAVVLAAAMGVIAPWS